MSRIEQAVDAPGGRISLRQRVGCWCHERWRTELVLSRPLARLAGMRWQALCNRRERLLPGSDDESWVCDWADSSWLTVARVFPEVGARLLKHCLQEWPVTVADKADDRRTQPPRVSVILPIGGRERMAQFRVVLGSLLGQEFDGYEVVVAECGPEPLLCGELPRSVTCVWVRPASEGDEFNKSRALNEGVRAAVAPIVLLHDADAVVPKCYLRSVWDRLQAGWEAVRPVRLQFCLGREESDRFAASHGTEMPARVPWVMQNNPGCSVAIRRDVYWQIGGHDERFVGWGGEDLEFLDRLKTRRLFAGSYAPAIHLWHPPAPKKASGDRNNALMLQLRSVPAWQRIKSLAATGGEERGRA